ncbi:hypothetical protein DSO57_1018802 [Entomophthora muscae]|uniref:Uncharacterized protein n=1 Tax=Entomophthora muscae TaxID=34485 RepID=A0ACC2T4J3_9FUNG|nr:hypothetical protein DSO57_1018802 [Entomophthora muscae]
MSGSLCAFKKEAISYGNSLIDINLFGQVDGKSPLIQDNQSHFQNGINFTHYYQDLMHNYNQAATKDCYNSNICLELTTSFFWTGKSRFVWSFECRRGQRCNFLIDQDSESWTAIQSDTSTYTLPVYSEQAYNVQYLRYSDPSRLTFSFMTYGPSSLKVFFNEVLALSKMQMLHKQSGGYMPVTIQKICQFNPSGISEGVFAIQFDNSYKNLAEEH